MPTCGVYTMRTQPRRRVSEGSGGNNKEEPIFLRKTFEMICSCDSDRACDLACWTQNGETFVVKDPDVFSQVVIPQFFKRERVCGASPQTVHGVVAPARQKTKRWATRAPQSFGGNHSVGSCCVSFLACCACDSNPWTACCVTCFPCSSPRGRKLVSWVHIAECFLLPVGSHARLAIFSGNHYRQHSRRSPFELRFSDTNCSKLYSRLRTQK